MFFLLATTFFLLAGGVNNESVDTAAGWIGMATAATAYWLASVELVNDIIGKGHEVIPLGRFRLSYSGATHVAGRIQSEGHRQALKDTKMGYLRRASINQLSPTLTTGSHYPKEDDERLRLDLEDIESSRSQ